MMDIYKVSQGERPRMFDRQAFMERLSRFLWVAAAISMIPGSVAAESVLSAPSQLASEEDGYGPGAKQEAKETADEEVSKEEAEAEPCLPGKVVGFTWGDVGVKVKSPDGIEYVKKIKVKGGYSIEEPKGRGVIPGSGGEKGYNTVAIWGDGPQPGENKKGSGVGMILAHSTQREPSLFFPRSEFAKDLEEIITQDNGKTTFYLDMDNGSRCSYSTRGPEDIIKNVPKIGKKGSNYSYASVLQRIDNESREAQDGRMVFVTCAGNPDLLRGTSQDATIVAFYPEFLTSEPPASP